MSLFCLINRLFRLKAVRGGFSLFFGVGVYTLVFKGAYPLFLTAFSLLTWVAGNARISTLIRKSCNKKQGGRIKEMTKDLYLLKSTFENHNQVKYLWVHPVNEYL